MFYSFIMTSRGSKGSRNRSGPANRDDAPGIANMSNANNNLHPIPEEQGEVDINNNNEPEAGEQQEHQSSQLTNPVPGIDPNVLQQLLTAAMTSANELYKQREKNLMDMVTTALAAQRVNTPEKMSPFEQVMLRGLTEMAMFDGEGTRTWEDFQREFSNKASMISSLPRTLWVKYLHSRVKGQPLNHARAIGLQLADGTLTTDSFEEYCTKMAQAMFGEAKTNTTKFHELLAVKQEGKFADASAFLKEKERLLNQLPPESMQGWVKAAAVLTGMNPLLVAAVSPNPHSPDGQFHSYEDLRKAVIATVGLNQSLLPNTPTVQHSPNDKGGWFGKSGKSNHNFSPRSGPYNKPASGNGNGNASGSGSGFKSPGSGQQQSAKGNAGPSGSGAKPKLIGNWPDTVCSDCGIAGHRSKSYKLCPKHQPNAQQYNGKGKDRA